MRCNKRLIVIGCNDVYTAPVWRHYVVTGNAKTGLSGLRWWRHQRHVTKTTSQWRHRKMAARQGWHHNVGSSFRHAWMGIVCQGHRTKFKVISVTATTEDTTTVKGKVKVVHLPVKSRTVTVIAWQRVRGKNRRNPSNRIICGHQSGHVIGLEVTSRCHSSDPVRGHVVYLTCVFHQRSLSVCRYHHHHQCRHRHHNLYTWTLPLSRGEMATRGRVDKTVYTLMLNSPHSGHQRLYRLYHNYFMLTLCLNLRILVLSRPVDKAVHAVMTNSDCSGQNRLVKSSCLMSHRH